MSVCTPLSFGGQQQVSEGVFSEACAVTVLEPGAYIVSETERPSGRAFKAVQAHFQTQKEHSWQGTSVTCMQGRTSGFGFTDGAETTPDGVG